MGGRENFVMVTACNEDFLETDANNSKGTQAWVCLTAIGRNEK